MSEYVAGLSKDFAFGSVLRIYFCIALATPFVLYANQQLPKDPAHLMKRGRERSLAFKFTHTSS